MEFKEVAFEPMNRIHKKEIEILNNLLKAINNNQNVINLFNNFLEDVTNHFSFEEELMKKYNFFAYIPHKMEHDRVLKELKSLNPNDKISLKLYLQNHFIPWLKNHLETMDTVTAGFFNMIGASPTQK
jgi:hemerythrin